MTLLSYCHYYSNARVSIPDDYIEYLVEYICDIYSGSDNKLYLESLEDKEIVLRLIIDTASKSLTYSNDNWQNQLYSLVVFSFRCGIKTPICQSILDFRL